jgi:hypothetical protein
MTRTPPVPSRPSRLLAGAFVVIGALAAAGCSQTDEGTPSPTTAAVVGTAATALSAPGPGDTTPGTGGRPADPTSLPEALRAVAEVSGGDPQEATCINGEVARGLPAAGQAGGRNQVVGAAVAACLPPAKLAAAVAQRIGAGALGTPVPGPAVDCIRATLVGSATDAAYSPFVGAVLIGDPAGARQSAAVFDAACGTALTAGG